MKKNYQKIARRCAGATRLPVMPERVSVAMAEIAEDVREGLLAMAVGAGCR